MSRIYSVLILAAVVGLFAVLPPADTARLAATDCGNLIELPVSYLDDTDWRTFLASGDLVQTEQGDAELLDESLSGVWEARLESEPESTLELESAAILGLKSPRLLWQALLSPQVTSPREKRAGQVLELRVRGYEADLGGDRSKISETLFAAVLRHLRAQSPKSELVVFENDLPDFPGILITADFNAGHLRLTAEFPDGARLAVQGEEAWSAPNSSSLLPPLVAILLAILLRKPVLALGAGVVTGAILIRMHAGESLLASLIPGIWDAGSVHLWNEVVDSDRMMIVAFVVFMLAMVGVMTRAGGIRGLMDRISRMAADARRTQIATWLMGLCVFFDDYANTILVGTTMRPLSDRFRIAREKLAYIVDSTAAPVAGISILSTWIAFEVSTFSSQLPEAGLSVSKGYEIFLQTLPYRFYCLFTLFFVGAVVISGRDFGPMLKAERRARGGELLREGASPMVSEAATSLQEAPHVTPRMRDAILPISAFVLTTLGYIFVVGGGPELFQKGELFTIQGATKVLYDGSGFAPLMWGSLAGFLLAAVLARFAGLQPKETLSAALASIRAMGVGLVILYLAWSIGSICQSLGTAPYLSILLGDALPPWLLPMILFALSGFVAFATGSSWSTMTILLPLVVGLGFTLGEQSAIGGLAMMVISIGAVLEGSIFGDHCSPISDTTVMSSIAAASDHIDHVRTQMPYSLVTMATAMVCGYLPAALWGLNPLISLALGAIVLGLLLLFCGRRATPQAA